MHKNIKTVAGCFTNVTCNVAATDGREVELTAYIAIGQERRPVPKAGANLFAFPAVEYGQHLYEIRADGKPIIFGFLIVRPSAFPVAEGTVDYTLTATLDSVDALHVDIELTPGPRGYSAYDIAVMEGFEGTESEWLEYMRQQTAMLAVEQVTPLMERAENARTGAEQAKADAQTAETNARGYAETATEAKTGAEQAKADAQTAETNARGYAETATEAKTGAEQAKADAQTAETNARGYATAATEASTGAEQAKDEALAAKATAEEQARIAAEAAAEVLGPGSVAVAAARPAVMVLLRQELESLLGDAVAWVVDTDGEKVVVHTDRLDGELLAAVEDMLERFVPGFIGLRQYNHDISIPWREIPDGFKVVEYLETFGQQTISCHKIAWGYNGRVEADLMWTNRAAAGWQSPWTLAGMPQNSEDAPEGADASWRRWSIMGWLRWDYGITGSESPDMVSGGTITEGVRYNIVKNAEKNYIDGKLVSSNGKAAWNWRYNVAPRLSGDGKNYGFWGRYFYFKAFLGDALELNLIPCLDPTGAPCMVDRVSLTAFYNSGPGDFTYPGKEEESTTYSLRRPVMYGQLTPHGVRRLYHVPRGYDGTREEYAAEYGFKVLVETVEPEPVEDVVWVPVWHETEEELVLEWVEEERR